MICKQTESTKCAETIEALEQQIASLEQRLRDVAVAEDEHCKDCCCARSWKALGVTNYTGKSIPEHIDALIEALKYARDTVALETYPLAKETLRKIDAALSPNTTPEGSTHGAQEK